MKRNTVTVVIGAVLLVIFGLLLFTFQVRVTQVAVVTTFGKPTRPIPDPGLYAKWPWPIQKVYYFDKPVQTFEDKYTEDYTADNNNLMTMVYVGWRISQPAEFFPKFGGSVENARRVLEEIVRTVKSSVVGNHPLSDFVSANPAGSKFGEIENEMLAGVQSQVRSNSYGIEIEFVGIKKLGFPESVTQSVFDRMTAERQVYISTAENNGKAEAQKIRSEADRRAAEMIAVAQGEATQIRGKGEAEAAKYLYIFQQNPGLASFLFRLRAMEDSLKQNSTLILDQQTPPFDVLRGSLTNTVVPVK